MTTLQWTIDAHGPAHAAGRHFSWARDRPDIRTRRKDVTENEMSYIADDIVCDAPAGRLEGVGAYREFMGHSCRPSPVRG